MTPKPIFIVNFKNYPEILGERSLALAKEVESATRESGVLGVVAPPAPLIGLVSSNVSIPVFSQGVDSVIGDRTTGAILPEAVKGAGGSGTLLNHSESRISAHEIHSLMPRLAALSMKVCICAGSAKEAVRLSKMGPEWVAVEPPELIGSGVAVSRAKPEVVSGTVSALRKSGFEGRVLCGAGIVSGSDVRASIELGADGILVSSSVVKSKDWKTKVSELTRSLV